MATAFKCDLCGEYWDRLPILLPNIELKSEMAAVPTAKEGHSFSTFVKFYMPYSEGYEVCQKCWRNFKVDALRAILLAEAGPDAG